jgi:hypothetical protein
MEESPRDDRRLRGELAGLSGSMGTRQGRGMREVGRDFVGMEGDILMGGAKWERGAGW